MIALASKIINALFSQADISQILLGIIAFSYYSLVLKLIPPPPAIFCHLPHCSYAFSRLHDALHNSYASSIFRSFSEAYVLPMRIAALGSVPGCLLSLYKAKSILMAEHPELHQG